jgi:hypothetical protein
MFVLPPTQENTMAGGSTSTSSMQQRLAWAASLAGALAGLLYGYDFGETLSGPWVGAVTGASSAVFGAMIAGSVAERMLSLITPRDRAL